jgi:hypothetical protein
MSLGAESYSCILLATRNGNQQEANIVPVAAVTKVSARADASPHGPPGLYRRQRVEGSFLANYHCSKLGIFLAWAVVCAGRSALVSKTLRLMRLRLSR